MAKLLARIFADGRGGFHIWQDPETLSKPEDAIVRGLERDLPRGIWRRFMPIGIQAKAVRLLREGRCVNLTMDFQARRIKVEVMA